MLTSARARTAALAVAAALTPLSVGVLAHADDDPKPVCSPRLCTGEVEQPEPPSHSPSPSQSPTPTSSPTARPGAPAAQYDVGLPAPGGPSAPVDECDLLRCVGVDLGVGEEGLDVTAVERPDPAPAADTGPAAPAGQPRALAPRPDPVAVAQRSVATLQMRPIAPGMTPLEPGSISIVGVPTWMWAENPTSATTGPITRTASVPGLSLTMTATMSGVTWDMGDGTLVECSGTGTKWSPELGTGDSPDCGHTYTKQGNYTATATSHWSVAWQASTGESGVITRDLSSTATVRVGEVQVINSTGGRS